MKIKMKKTAKGADDGVAVKTYEKGETYEVSEALAKCFLDAKVAAKCGSGKGSSAGSDQTTASVADQDEAKTPSSSGPENSPAEGSADQKQTEVGPA